MAPKGDHLDGNNDESKIAMILDKIEDETRKPDVQDNQRQSGRSRLSLLTGHLKSFIALALLLVYLFVPLPAALQAGNYPSLSSVSSLFPFSSSSPCPHHESIDPLHHPSFVHHQDLDAHHHHHARGYKAIFGSPSKKNAFFAKGRPSIHISPRNEEYNKKIEQAFLKVPNNESCLAASRSYTGFSHIAGKEGDFQVSHIVKQQWEKLLGLRQTGKNEHVFDAGSKQSKRALLSQGGGDVRVWTDKYYVLLNHPTPLKESKTSIQLHDTQGNVIFKAKLQEDALEEDPTSKHGNEDVPPFHGYSKAGSAEGQLVYAHSGTVEDFKRLKDNGIDMAGKIAFVRYGGNFRGLKVKAAQEAGAVGCIIYSDPAEDGDVTVDNGYLPYPAGPARQPSSLQRGSVQFLSKYPGDPTTPGKPSYKDSKRVEGSSMPDIPSLPLSYEDAIPLLHSLDGRGPCFNDWKGGLAYQGVQYCSGPSEGNLTMTNDAKSDIYPIWNTYARIEGHIKDEVVMLGNHRDAWVFGAVDPNSGTASIHEVIKAFGELMKTGWKPLRTILIASWDAEEYGLVGSTEFGEDYAEHASKVVAYLNLDAAVGGSYFSMHASPSLADLFRNVSVAAGAVVDAGDIDVGPLGSGSDYTVFLQHLGIASSDMGYRGTKTDPVYHYHSIYDSEYWKERYGDPGFGRHIKAANAIGLAALRLTESPILPLNLTRYAYELDSYLSKVQETAKSASIDDLDFSKLSEAVSSVQSAALQLDQDSAEVLASLIRLQDEAGLTNIDKHQKKKKQKQLIKKIRSINKRKMSFERGFISRDGLPRRQWYKHLGVAPGENLGYGATTFPGVTEAITIAGSRETAENEISRLTSQLELIAKNLRRSHGH